MTKTSERIAITGNTYPVKEQLKALGGRWDAARKAWMVPATRADQARALVGGSAAPKTPGRSRGTWTGCSCGSVQEYTKASDCWTCKHDAE